MKTIILEKNGPIAFVKINRPESLNALNKELLEELAILIDLLTRGQQIKAMVLTGEGDKAFVAGADIKEMLQMTHVEMLRFCEMGQEVAHVIENAPFIIIAAVNGYALGGGLELALACDFIYASTTAKLGLPEVTLGIIPGFGGTQRLSRAAGTRLAKEMITTGKTISAPEAKEIGIVNRLCEPSQLLDECFQTASTIAKNSQMAVEQAKKAINVGYSLNIDDALELEKNMCAVCFSTPERQEAMQAFVDKKGKTHHAPR